jgi:FkbM family methyltransferase
MSHTMALLFDGMRRAFRKIVGYRSPLYVFGSSVLRDISLVSKEGFSGALYIRSLMTIKRCSEHRLTLSRLMYPITVRSGTSDISAVINNVVREEYGLAITERLSPRNIIDCGAFIGDTSSYFLSRYKTANLVSLEPNIANFALAERNLKPYGDRVRLIKAAVWWKTDILRFSGEAQGGGLSDSGVEVQALAIGELINLAGGHVDILKLDIEGAEDQIFLHSPEDWLPKVDHILIELHGPEIQSRVLSTLTAQGFFCSPYRSIWYCSRAAHDR